MGILTAVSTAEAHQLQILAAGRRVLECGAEFGYSTIQLAQVAESVVSVDWQGGDPFTGDHQKARHQSVYYWISNLLEAFVLDKVIPIVGKFEDVLPLLARSFNMAFLDGDHRYDHTKRDIELIAPLLNPGSVFAFHDYGREGPGAGWQGPAFGVTRAVDEYARYLGVRIECVDSLAWVVTPT